MDKSMHPDKYARDTLERYTGSSVNDFGSYILLVNFQKYLSYFAQASCVDIQSGHWSVVHDKKNDISVINFGVGSPAAGIITHCLSYLPQIKCVIMLGMCGGIDDRLAIGDLLIPTASVRDEGTSKHYLQPNVPAQPSFWINRICEQVIKDDLKKDLKSGIMMTTDYRMWEFDNSFIEYILKHRILALDMEIATLFSVAYALNLPIGAIMLISDMPLKKGGIKSKKSSEKIFQQYTEEHFNAGLKVIEAIKTSDKRDRKERLQSEW